MARKQARVPSTVSPQMADDFKLIRGIGPALAGRLHNAGIRTYSQLASLSPAELATRVTSLSAKQIAQQDWISQARKLIPKTERPKSHKKEPVFPAIHQHYENFTIEFLLDAENVMRRTRVLHVQSGDADTWAGWETKQLIDFLARHTQVRMPEVKLAHQEISAAHRQTSQSVNGESISTVGRIPGPIPLYSSASKLAQPGTEIAKPVSQSPATIELAGRLHLRDLKVVSIDSDIPIFSLPRGKRYMIKLTLDLSEVIAPSDAPLIYKATIIVKQIGGTRHPVAEASSILQMSDSVTLDIVGTSLSPGIYLLDAFVSLTFDKAVPGLMAFRKGDLLQVD